MFSKLNQTRLSVRIMLALLLLATVAFALMAWELASAPFSGWSVGFTPPARDMAFLAALFCACGFVGWMYAADLDISLRGLNPFDKSQE